ncbi:MAG: hypothetical protein HYY46_12365 [Deltaproteobacteria bacterium]|nr:hypothetical protein [Deltaproteobacteria bacterium]
MSVGASILLSAIFLGVIALFITTKDRWKWKNILRWSAISLLVLAVLLGSSVYIYHWISNRPKLSERFWDVPLDATKNDIKFLKGAPSEKRDGDNVWVYKWEKDSNCRDSTYAIFFDNDKIRFIGYYGPNSVCSPHGIQGINLGASYQMVLKKFGQPNHVTISEDDLERTISFTKYNAFFTLRENHVTAYGIFNPAFGPIKYGSEKKIGSTR